MPLSEIDFGKSIVPLIEGEDAFFVDTNVLVAYFYEKDIKHWSLWCNGDMDRWRSLDKRIRFR
ncbi:hypothetical protein [Paenibacillus durus]|uniref:PIN domain-containing protein n=1 Tax=Paenibacillus durus TaxID=44251 RepID=A0A089HS87_PAEDU|nr:hypothetical protein [Paenibacillus durus]AIQ13615.1 hypothetical protein PDUR_18070 [Paenibacillus durus]